MVSPANTEFAANPPIIAMKAHTDLLFIPSHCTTDSTQKYKWIFSDLSACQPRYSRCILGRAMTYPNVKWTGSWIACLLLAFSQGWAGPKEMKTLDQAYIDVLNRKFKLAIKKAAPLLDSLALNQIEEIILAHQILALSYCEIADFKQSSNHLRALYVFDPDENFNGLNPSPECKTFLNPPRLPKEKPDETKKRKKRKSTKKH